MLGQRDYVRRKVRKISVFSGFLGLCLGFGICMLRRINCKPTQWFGAVFVRLIQGTPIVVFLMILYYGIFGSADISEILVAVIGFSINFAAYSSEMMRYCQYDDGSSLICREESCT